MISGDYPDFNIIFGNCWRHDSWPIGVLCPGVSLCLLIQYFLGQTRRFRSIDRDRISSEQGRDQCQIWRVAVCKEPSPTPFGSLYVMPIDFLSFYISHYLAQLSSLFAILLLRLSIHWYLIMWLPMASPPISSCYWGTFRLSNARCSSCWCSILRQYCHLITSAFF